MELRGLWNLASWVALIGMASAAAVTGLLQLDERGVSVLGAMPRSLPPIATLPLLSPLLLSKLSAGALAINEIVSSPPLLLPCAAILDMLT